MKKQNLHQELCCKLNLKMKNLIQNNKNNNSNDNKNNKNSNNRILNE